MPAPIARAPVARVATRTLRLLALILPALFPGNAHGQATGAIIGTVTAAESSQPLAGAQVVIVGTRLGALTDDRGHYRIAGLTAGTYSLVATRIGREAERHAVTVTDGSTTTVDFALAEGSLLLPGVVVTASRTAEPARQIAATVNVMTSEAVRTSPARTTDDLLREMPGVELPRTSSTVSGPEEIVSIRGADEGRTLVLLDGVPLNDPWGEWIQWNRAPRFQLDRVEVLEGGGSSLYGNYAMGGVISLFSRPIARRGYDLMASGGTRSNAELSAYGSDVHGPLGYSLSADYGSGGGYELLRPDQRGPIDQPSSVTRRNINGRVEYALGGSNTVFLSANYFDDDRSLGTPLSEPNWRHIGSGVVGGNFGNVLGGTMQLRAFGQSQRYRSTASSVNADRTSEVPLVAQLIPSHDVGGSVQWSRPAGIFDVVSVGGDVRSMVGRLEENVYRNGTVAGTRTSGGSQLVGGVFVQGILAPIERLRIEASARVDAWRSYDGSRVDSASSTPTATTFPEKRNAAFAPRVGAHYEVLPSLTVRGSFYQAFRAPTLSEEYRTFFAGPNTFMGNPALTPEYLTGYDAGLDWQPLPVLELRGTVFWNRYRDLDDFTFSAPDPATGGVILQRQNVGEAKSQGVEGEVAVRLLDVLQLAGSYNYNDARVTSTGEFVNRVPLQRGSARVTYSSPSIATVNVIYRYEGPNHALGGARLAPFAVVDLDARRQVYANTQLFASIENLFDRQYVVNVSGPLESMGLPRTVRAGVSIDSF